MCSQVVENTRFVGSLKFFNVGLLLRVLHLGTAPVVTPLKRPVSCCLLLVTLVSYWLVVG
jgi:hypothetical protein